MYSGLRREEKEGKKRHTDRVVGHMVVIDGVRGREGRNLVVKMLSSIHVQELFLPSIGASGLNRRLVREWLKGEGPRMFSSSRIREGNNRRSLLGASCPRNSIGVWGAYVSIR